MTALACYAVRESIGGYPIDDFDSIIDFENWGGSTPEQLTPDPSLGVDARLYLVSAHPGQPDWVPFLRDGFGASFSAPMTSSPGALLVVRFRWRETTRFMAFSFGSGRFLLRKSAIERRFGVHAALNIVFDGDTASDAVEADRLRSVDAKRIAANPVRMRHQTSRRAEFEAFNLDRDQDFLHGVTGRPRDASAWGSNVTGTDHLNVNVSLSFHEVPAFCRRLLDMRQQATYQQKFGWIDDVHPVTDPATIARLSDHVIERVRVDASEFELAVPEIVDWDRIARFRYPYERRPAVDRAELRLRDYVGILRSKRKLDDLDMDVLKRQYFDAIDGDGLPAYQWHAWNCLSGEFELDDQTYVLDDGDFYEVQTDYLASLNDFIDTRVPGSELALPDADVRMTEGAYNAYAAEQAGLLLMDTRTVRISRSTTAIEVCDLLSPKGQFVHVKRKLGSSLLSHLFAQGATSAELLQGSTEFRAKAANMVGLVSTESLARQSGITAEDFSFVADSPRTAEIEIVYAVLADWRSGTLSSRLPFFSKLTLRRTAQDLSSRGFMVSHRRVQTNL